MKGLYKLFLVVGVLLAGCSEQNSEFNTPDQKPAFADWQIVAKSSLIVIGKISNKTDQLGDKANSTLIVLPTEILKGEKLDRVNFTCEGDLSKLENRLSNSEHLVFLINSGDNPGKFYLAESLPLSVLFANEQQLKSVRHEIHNQKLINDNWFRLKISKPEESDKRIKRLLDGLLDTDTQEDSWKELLKLKFDAIPALVRSMNDKRNLSYGDFSSCSRKSTSRYDDHFHYSPKIVQDVVSILLNQLTQIDFHTTVNGGSAEERNVDLSGWRTWLYYNKK